MARTDTRDRGPQDAVAAYKQLLARILERRPSGTRQRLAMALAKNRSFVSQIANPAYSTPIPASHLGQIFEVCHFSTAERQEFTRLYGFAHPGKVIARRSQRPAPALELPDLGSEAGNKALHALVNAFARDVAMLIEREKGKRP